MMERTYLAVMEGCEFSEVYGPVKEATCDKAIIKLMRRNDDLADPAGEAMLFQIEIRGDDLAILPFNAGYMERMRKRVARGKRRKS